MQLSNFGPVKSGFISISHMNNTHGKLILACVIACMAATACKSSKSAHASGKEGKWQDQPIVIDGQNNDWPSPYPYYDDKAKIGYAVTNDKDNLYITMQTGDRMTVMKILRTGLNVWIDTGGKKSMTMGINYPMENPETPMHLSKQKLEDQQPMEKPDADQLHKRILESANSLAFTGFSACNGSFLVRQNNNCGIQVRIGFDEYNTLIWEATVPFKALYGKDQLTAADAKKPISVGFAIKGMKRPSTDGQGQGGNGGGGGMHSGGGGMGGGMGGGGMRGGGGGMRGGGRGGGGGMHGGGSSDRDALYESSRTWYTTGLAVKS
jgi:hypothetical protein